jgi:hypothetical protein
MVNRINKILKIDLYSIVYVPLAVLMVLTGEIIGDKKK